MKYLLLISTLIILITANCYGQTGTEDFKIELSAFKVQKNSYKAIHLVDVRPDKTNLGVVQLGAFNKKVFVVPKVPMDEQFQDLFHSLTETKGEKDLFLLLRQFNFAEVSSATSEKGYCHIRAVLFTKAGDRFQKLDAIDTVVVVKSLDVTRSLLRQGSKTFTDFIAGNLNKEPDVDVSYSSQEVVNFDIIEKQKLPLYITTDYKSGIYKSFKSFIEQQPDEQNFSVEFYKNQKPKAVKLNRGKVEKLTAKEFYAFVYEGVPYISSGSAYYPLTKRDNDFYFISKASVAPNTTEVMLASAFFGVLGGLIASTPGSALFEMKIDHLTGGFIRTEKIKSKNN